MFIIVDQKQRMSSKQWHDISLIIVVVLGMVITIVLDSAEFLRILFGLPFILYLPGYVLTSSLFARQQTLTTIERNGLAVGLSIAAITLIAPILDALGYDLSLWPIILGESTLITIGTLLMILRRWQLGTEAYAPNLPQFVRHAWPAMLIAILLIGGAVRLLVTVDSAANYTEFYLLQDNGVGNYPRASAVGESVSTELTVINNERDSHRYFYEIRAVDSWNNDRTRQLFISEPFALDRGATHSEIASWQMPWAGNDQQVHFLLFIDDVPEPYRELTLWLNVSD